METVPVSQEPSARTNSDTEVSIRGKESDRSSLPTLLGTDFPAADTLTKSMNSIVSQAEKESLLLHDQVFLHDQVASALKVENEMLRQEIARQNVQLSCLEAKRIGMQLQEEISTTNHKDLSREIKNLVNLSDSYAPGTVDAIKQVQSQLHDLARMRPERQASGRSAAIPDGAGDLTSHRAVNMRVVTSIGPAVRSPRGRSPLTCSKSEWSLSSVASSPRLVSTVTRSVSRERCILSPTHVASLPPRFVQASSSVHARFQRMA
eukprot:TRINITY_DN1021_c0_g3_i2.p1 TRINITY_DN1021_c0_g3~~TRINITY_DN1021_c0_g3_i2.p1  ORF type:complete len:263 (-),score=18.97 TRINITY_DN1021_c0_g3_i2:375-1163(-)